MRDPELPMGCLTAWFVFVGVICLVWVVALIWLVIHAGQWLGRH